MKIFCYSTKTTNDTQVTPQIGDLFYMLSPYATQGFRLITRVVDTHNYANKKVSWVEFTTHSKMIGKIILWHECIVIEHEF